MWCCGGEDNPSNPERLVLSWNGNIRARSHPISSWSILAHSSIQACYSDSWCYEQDLEWGTYLSHSSYPDLKSKQCGCWVIYPFLRYLGGFYRFDDTSASSNKFPGASTVSKLMQSLSSDSLRRSGDYAHGKMYLFTLVAIYTNGLMMNISLEMDKERCIAWLWRLL